MNASEPTGTSRSADTTVTDLTDPSKLPFRIHNNDWQLSPDGNRIVFVNNEDRNLWMLTLPPAGGGDLDMR